MLIVHYLFLLRIVLTEKNIKAVEDDFYHKVIEAKYTEAVGRRCIKNGILRNFSKFTGKHLCQSLFFNKVENECRYCMNIMCVGFPDAAIGGVLLKSCS